jgi:hypothetical protein
LRSSGAKEAFEFASRIVLACAPRENFFADLFLISIHESQHIHNGMWLPLAMCRFPKCHTNEGCLRFAGRFFITKPDGRFGRG